MPSPKDPVSGSSTRPSAGSSPASSSPSPNSSTSATPAPSPNESLIERKRTRVSKVAFAYCMGLFFMLVFISSTLALVSKRNIPNTQKNELALALRGAIISQDNFTLAASRTIYRAEVDLRSLDPGRLELFLRLYQIYSSATDRQMSEIKRRMRTQKNPNFILSRTLSSKQANYLEELAKKLYLQGFFRSFINPATGVAELRGLSIIEQKEDRQYLLGDTLTPAIGYTRAVLDEEGEIFKNLGVKGLEKYYENCLLGLQNERIRGLRDIGGNIILGQGWVEQRRINGCDLHLNISLKLQKSVEKAIDARNADLNASEILVAVMDSPTGQLLALASSRRFNPARRGPDLALLNASAVEYGYEAGSVIKPFIFATALRLGKIKLNETINTFNGSYRLGRFLIQDDHKMKQMSAAEVIIYSSNIGMIQIAKRLSSFQVVSGLKIFKFGERSGIDLPYEQPGSLPEAGRLREIEKSVLSYGYGLRTTFIQLLGGYNIFNNDGYFITPRLAKSFYQDGRTQSLDDEIIRQKVLSPAATATMKQILIDVIEKGTGKKAMVPGIIIGGKTGTARIAEKQGYSANRYNASFFGFANDATRRYTIGVLVRNPTKPYSYYAAQSALPMFRDVVDILLREDFLEPQKEPAKK